jgi:hypothetical protein
MDAAQIQAKVYFGYAKAAGPSNPTAGSPLQGLNAQFTVGPSGFNFDKAPGFKDAAFNALLDGTQTQVGDYLVGASDTYYVASQEPLLPILCVRCNRTLTLFDPGPAKVYGADTNYGGTSPGNETAVMTAWPASVLFDARGRATEVGLPTDLPSPFFTILLPHLAGVDVRTSMFITDDLDRRYTIAASELTQLGWRIMAQIAVT